MTDVAQTHTPRSSEAFRYWLKLGCISFGGPAGQIALMQHDLVERLKWIDTRAFLNGLNFCMLLPGPEAQQLATYIGWRLHGLRGALTAGLLFVLPGAAALFALSWLAADQGDAPLVAAAFAGLKPVVVAIIAHAVWKIAKRALTSWPAAIIAGLAFLAVEIADVPFPLVVAVAGAMGFGLARWPGSPVKFAAHTSGSHVTTSAPLRWGRLIGVVVLYVALLGVGVGSAVLAFGREPFLEVAWLMTKAAFVTFGGAYAVLPYVADAAVNTHGWLDADAMINGLALAETTPGPLILVLQYVGFFAGWNGALGGMTPVSPLAAATVGSLVATYATFLPSIFFILIGAPLVERIPAYAPAAAALSAITAAVVGVIVTLGLFFADKVLLANGQVNIGACAVAIVALFVLLRWHVSVHWLVIAGALGGMAWTFAGS
ncbi:MAG: chromate efflux transporter [Rhodospirillaceae bacterium]|nr:chromate efflux transporter [Rhodospirillaceae bacterium]